MFIDEVGAKENRDAFVKVQTMIYQRMRETKK